jgi:2-dehydro-3-deoxyphosphogluconate aldolase / (4S)-4-hydroxy-2-oxoglutarate aldolase
MLNLLKQSRVVPVIVIDDAENAVPLAQALVAGGISIIEVTLRTPTAMESIKQIAQHVPEITLGAGTIMDPDQFKQVKDLGAKFAVSPGLSLTLVSAANAAGLPYLPGVATASEIMRALHSGIEVMKFFPVETLGGLKAVTMMQSVFPQAKFCVTGGVTLENISNYLALEPVVAIGGSWLATREMIKQKKWAEITAMARKTMEIL